MARPREFDPDTVADAVVEDFWSSTYSATSTDELCRSTGLSRSSLYNTFGSKRDLYLMAIGRYAEMKQAQRIALLEAEDDGRALLERIIETVLAEQWSDPDRRACFGINACLDEGTDDAEIRTALETNAQAYDAMLTAVIGRGQADGSISSQASAAGLARVVHAMLDGLQVRTRIRPSREDQRRDVDSLMALL
ncbi:TetR/AcrR family transcriptional regulator [Aeromicrobium sp. P5_D10]